ncbi:MAG: arsinothricin resistance N-acetyltransferase ArsN1 family A [Gammaproteobacteria bacterium]
MSASATVTADARIVTRLAYLDDAPALAEIYTEGIEDRLATLETEPSDAQERLNWLKQRGARHPVIVAERDGRVLGWASINAFNPRAAYEHVADFSIYVARARRGQGIGACLLEAITERARMIGYHKLVLAMFPWNESGLALYRRNGFRVVGTYREQGKLDGKWVDTLLMEKILS